MATTLQVNASYYISNIDDIEVLVELESQSDNKNELANLDFSTRTLNVKPKKLPLITKLLQKLPNGTKILLNLPNDFISFILHFKNSLRRGALQQNCWISRAPPTKIQINFREEQK